MRVILRYLSSVYDAEEVLQDTFIKIFDKIEQFNPKKGQFESWTRRIAINQALIRIRQNKAIKIKLTDLHATQEIITNDALTKFSYKELLHKIDKLDQKHATLIKLRLIDGYKFCEIAKMLDLKEAYARKILSRARQKLIKKLGTSVDPLVNRYH